jgi:hypothetical protein
MKKNNTYLFAGAIGIVIIGSYFVYSYIKKNKPVPTSVEEDKVVGEIKNNSQEPSNPNFTINSSFPLKNGSKGKQVVVLQKWLNDNEYSTPKLVVDGAFGSKTELAVKQMQQFPNQKALLDYNSFNESFKMGQVTKDFYDIFVIKAKTLSSSTSKPFLATPSISLSNTSTASASTAVKTQTEPLKPLAPYTPFTPQFPL